MPEGAPSRSSTSDRAVVLATLTANAQALASFQSALQTSQAMHEDRIDTLCELVERFLIEDRAAHVAHDTSMKDLTAALKARTEVYRELGAGLLGWLDRRWLSLLIGLAAGLGVAGGVELLQLAVGQLVAGRAP